MISFPRVCVSDITRIKKPWHVAIDGQGPSVEQGKENHRNFVILCMHLFGWDGEV